MEAVAQGLRAFRENEWVADVGHEQTQISVIVKHPEVEHRVRVQDFVRWLESQGRTPKEVSLKSRLTDLLNMDVAVPGNRAASRARSR
jgi:hypothetical protein